MSVTFILKGAHTSVYRRLVSHRGPAPRGLPVAPRVTDARRQGNGMEFQGKPARGPELREAPGRHILSASSLKPQASSLKPQASSLKPQASSLKPQASSLKPQASSLKPQASSLKPQASSLKPQASSLKPQASSLKNRSGAGPAARLGAERSRPPGRGLASFYIHMRRGCGRKRASRRLRAGSGHPHPVYAIHRLIGPRLRIGSRTGKGRNVTCSGTPSS